MSEQLQHNKKPSALNNPGIMYLAVLTGAGLLYVISCAPGVLWQDSGEFQLRIWNGDLQGELGLALSHPLYIIIGIAAKHIPFGEFAYRINLISSIAGAFAVANLFLIIRLWLGKTLPALIGALSLGFSWTLWQQSSIAEVYTLHLALFGAELIMLVKYCRTKRPSWLYLLAMVNALAVANHMFAAIDLVCYTVFVFVLLTKKDINFKHIGVMALLWFIGALPYEYLIVRNIVEGGSVTKTLLSAAFGNMWAGDVLNVSMSSSIIKENLIFILYNFPTPNILLFPVGVYFLCKVCKDRWFANIVMVLLVLLFAFAFRYTVPDRYVFFMPFYYLLCILIGFGADIFMTKVRLRHIHWVIVVLCLLPVGVYFVTPALAQRLNVKIPTRRTIPYRNDYVWFLQPWKRGYRGPERFADDIFAIAAEDSAVYSDSTTVRPLLYAQQVEGIRGDLTIFHTLDRCTAELLLAETSLYVTTIVPGYCPGFLLENYDFTPMGPIWRVVEKK